MLHMHVRTCNDRELSIEVLIICTKGDRSQKYRHMVHINLLVSSGSQDECAF